jgi:hypothetical protein
MTTLIFDTLDFAERAEKAGFTREQAEFQAREAANAIENKLASKEDLNTETSGIRKDLTSFREEMAKEFKALENRMIIKFGVMIIAAMSAHPIISKFFSAPGVTQ